MLRQGGRRSRLQVGMRWWEEGIQPNGHQGKNNATEDWHRERCVLIAFLLSNLMSHHSGEEQRATRNAPGVQCGENSHTQPAVNGSYFNRNTDLRREERPENRDANSTSQEQHDCKYCLPRPRRQADHMHHVETFTKSVKFFSSTIF